MNQPQEEAARDQRAGKHEVSPLELFFDLVFVFALAQLSHHLYEHLSWHGVAETLVLLIAVHTVWSSTSFEATLPEARKSHAQWLVLVVMLLALFMNAAISRAWADGAWWFVVPYLVCQFGHATVTALSAPDTMLRAHYLVMLGWTAASTPLWLLGAAAGSDARLGWWAAAAALDLVGAWFSHPLPGRSARDRDVEFDADRLVERCRLFLLIALGETVLTTGTALVEAPLEPLTVLVGTLSLASIVGLWMLYFGSSDHHVDDHLEHSSDPLRTARRVMNSQVIVVAGLVALAVGQESVIAHPEGDARPAVVLLLFGGALLYVLVQAWYLSVVVGGRTHVRLLGAAVLVLGAAIALAVPPYAALALVAAVLAVLAGLTLRDPAAVG